MKIPSYMKEHPVLKLILGLVVFFFTISSLLYLSYTSSFYPEELDYVGVFTEKNENAKYFIGLYPLIEQKTMGIVITEWGGYDHQSRCLMVVPDNAENISFLQMPEREGITYPDKIAESTDTIRIPYDRYENLSLAKENGGVLVVKPDAIDDYYGVEVFVPGWIRQTSLSQVSIVIPLYAMGDEQIPGVSQVTKYIVQVQLPKNYELINSVPKPTRFKVTGNNLAVYQFDVDASESDLMLTLENRLITRDLNNIRVILGTLLGFSTMFSITNTIEILTRKKEIFRSK